MRNAIAFFSLAGVLIVPDAVIGQEQVVHAEKKRAAAACDVGKPHFRNLDRRFSLNEFSDGVFDDIADDVFRCVINAASLADFWLFFDAYALVGGNDDLPQEALVNGPENMNGDGVEVVGRIYVS